MSTESKSWLAEAKQAYNEARAVEKKAKQAREVAWRAYCKASNAADAVARAANAN